MTNSIDDWLNSIGIDENTEDISAETVEEAPSENTAEGLSVSVVPAIPTQEPISQNLSEEDFNDILTDMGFQEGPEIVDAEEIIDEENNENADAGRDWQPEQALAVENQVEGVEGEGEEVVNTSSEETSLTNVTQEEPLLPENSPTLLMNDATSRFSGTEWFDEIQKQRIILAGIGGIGSNLAFQLARMNPEALFLYDDDRVERVNMSGQLFSMRDVGMYKVNAISEMLLSYTSNRHVYALTRRYTDQEEACDVMMCGFDNMEARRTFFNAWHNHMLQYSTTEERAKCLYLDGRLSIDTLQVFCITGDNEYACDKYDNEYLFSDAEADATVCSMKQTTYLACMIGSIMTNLFTNFVANSLNPTIPYDLPFFTEYDAQNMIFKTVN